MRSRGRGKKEKEMNSMTKTSEILRMKKAWLDEVEKAKELKEEFLDSFPGVKKEVIKLGSKAKPREVFEAITLWQGFKMGYLTAKEKYWFPFLRSRKRVGDSLLEDSYQK